MPARKQGIRTYIHSRENVYLLSDSAKIYYIDGNQGEKFAAANGNNEQHFQA